ncbi:DUF2786 domain-containing protein [Providencia rettgeri]|nr:DUF2786 domain-containing protein [Providencia rettgeri]MBX6949720.1 DUF2786 domain-containing protein [Providencia rettgeri]MBX6958025.1 DUF2786 domain-containing protein [Providencia rettgeri]MBX6974682.1 DUF2786 domain-containing protein [Providencia rettgeri]MBX6990499.1 DUF2786 domain-containing protein [Providencia rettgeri]MBX7008244.1 DUF2786 domain-containing protein [Providencia rettgeri]
MNTNKERYFQKIKKLLNKARNNSSAEEAATALRMAQKLMQEHGLSESDVALSEITECKTHKTPSNAARPPQYMLSLIYVISKAFGVRHYLSWNGIFKVRRSVVFYGSEERPQIACYAFEVLSRQLSKGRTEYRNSLHKNTKPSKRTDLADTWSEAWVNGVYQAITKFATTEHEDKQMDTFLAKLKEKHNTTDVSGRESHQHKQSDQAANDGYRAGKKVRLAQGVGDTGYQPTNIGFNPKVENHA